jgi:hypothetical protein
MQKICLRLPTAVDTSHNQVKDLKATKGENGDIREYGKYKENCLSNNHL